MDIFEINGGYAFPTAHALGIQPFKRIWEQDSSDGKGDAEKVLRYIDFMCNPRKSNIFFGIKDEEERAKAVKKEIWGDEEVSTTLDMVQGCMTFTELVKIASPSYGVLEAAMGAAKALEKFYKSVDFTMKSANGNSFLYKPKEVQSSLKELADTMRNLEEARQKVFEELSVASKTRKDREPNSYEE